MNRPQRAGGVCLSSAHALGNTIAKMMLRHQDHRDRRVCLVFDFNKTLTNGGSGPEVSVEKKIRGGSHTAEALQETLFLKFILIARDPTISTIETLKADRVLQALALNFGPAKTGKPVVEDIVKQNDDTVPIAHLAHVYASAYKKAAGIEAIIAAHTARGLAVPTHVYFVDDTECLQKRHASLQQGASDGVLVGSLQGEIRSPPINHAGHGRSGFCVQEGSDGPLLVRQCPCALRINDLGMRRAAPELLGSLGRHGQSTRTTASGTGRSLTTQHRPIEPLQLTTAVSTTSLQSPQLE